MMSRSNVERASVLFSRRDELIKAAQLVLNGDDFHLSAKKPEGRRDGPYIPDPFPRAAIAVLHLGDEFKQLVEAELRAQVDDIGRELRCLGIADDFNLDDEPSHPV